MAKSAYHRIGWIHRLFLLGLGIVLTYSSCVRPPHRVTEAPDGPVPRVRLKLDEFRENTSLWTGPRTLVECYTNEKIKNRFYGLFKLDISLSRSGLSLVDENLGGLASSLSRVLIKPGSNPPRFQFQDKTYRGDLEIICNPDKGSFVAINELDVESYLKGVLPAEMGERAPEEYEALKAQAVAARTYALYKLRHQVGSNNYLHPTVLDQVYHGYDSELQLSNKAVDDTRGQVLTYRGQLISAYYHAICGGFTEEVSEVWGGERKPYLHSVPDGDFCGWAKSYMWEESFTPEELLEKVAAYTRGRDIDPEPKDDTLKSVSVLSRTGSGRVKDLLIQTTAHKYILKSDRIRWALSRSDHEIRILPSSLFEVSLRKDSGANIISVHLFGKGKGHGVGMCQCGAIGRSRKGYKYDQILKYYYSGTHLTKLY